MMMTMKKRKMNMNTATTTMRLVHTVALALCLLLPLALAHEQKEDEQHEQQKHQKKSPHSRLMTIQQKQQQHGPLTQTQHRHLSSRFLQAHHNSKKVDDEFIIEFFPDQAQQGLRVVEGFIQQEHPKAQILNQYNTVFPGVCVNGIPTTAARGLIFTWPNIIARIEQDIEVNITMPTTAATWGLDRIDQTDLPLDRAFHLPTKHNDDDDDNDNDDNDDTGSVISGKGVDIYILDTGVRITHTEFTGRIETGKDFTGEHKEGQDPQGHGTHVAGSAAGSTFGVAPGARIIPIRVLRSNGSGTSDMVIKGIDWAIANAQKTGRRSVINMSLGAAGRSVTQNYAVERAVSRGIPVVVAAGNDGNEADTWYRDACNHSPASAEHAITVASSTVADQRSSFSNYGLCVNIFAPGSNVLSAAHTADTATRRLSGTSMASPHVAGAAALLLEAKPDAPATAVGPALASIASANKISDVRESPNLLLFTSNIRQDMTIPEVNAPPTYCQDTADWVDGSGYDCYDYTRSLSRGDCQPYSSILEGTMGTANDNCCWCGGGLTLEDSPETDPDSNAGTGASTSSPTSGPTASPSLNPTHPPTKSPTSSPTDSPTANPTFNPSMNPTHSPTKATDSPTANPTFSHTKSPEESATKTAATTAATTTTASTPTGETLNENDQGNQDNSGKGKKKFRIRIIRKPQGNGEL